MKVLVITSSPNKDGLTAACGQAATIGLVNSGVEVIMARLNDLNMSNCHACGNGFGTCKPESTCQVKDDFQSLLSTVCQMDGYVFATPVYWGDMSESAKAFVDRLRRCEAYNRENNNMHDKPILCIAAAGGSGNGTLSCLSSMERFVMHVGAEKFDFIGVTQKNRSYMLEAIRSSAEKMAQSLSGK